MSRPNLSKDADKELEEILDRELSTTIRYQKGEAVGVTIHGIDRAIEAINSLMISKAEALLKLMAEELEARNQYPWHKIQKHATHNVPITNLDKDPSGDHIDYQECYLLPKKWVDEEAVKALQDGEAK